MLTFTTYSEAGGVGKTTLAANLAVAEVRAGKDVLAVDMDPQEGSLSHLFGVDENRSESDADNLVRHMVGRSNGDFDDLIRQVEGVNIVPGHNMLERLSELLHREEQQAVQLGEEYEPTQRLLNILKKEKVPEEYDTLIIDPPATANLNLYNSIVATRSLVIPIELSGKGQRSVDGLKDLVAGLEEHLGINVGVLAAVPNGYEGTRDQDEILEEIEEMGYDVPVVLRKRASLFEGCWRQQCSAFQYVEEHRGRQRDYETETLEKIEKLAAHLRLQTKEATA